MTTRPSSSWPALDVERWPLDRLKPFERNSRVHSEEQIAQIAASMEQFGWTIPILATEDGTIIAGHARQLAAQLNGYAEAPVTIARGWTEAQIRAYVIADNKLTENSSWDEAILAEELAFLRAEEMVEFTGFTGEEVDRLIVQDNEDAAAALGNATLAERFGIVPFSVLNAREGWWQDRKRAWLSLGIRSDLGRGDNLLKFSETLQEPDPVKRAAKRKARAKASA